MFTNSILFQELMLAAPGDSDVVLLMAGLQGLVTAVENFESFITKIVTPLLIVSGLATGVRS